MRISDWSSDVCSSDLPDALLDAFTDSDFRLGGTNARGWTIGGTYGLRKNTNISVRWMNGEEISGPPFRFYVLQADLNVIFCSDVRSCSFSPSIPPSPFSCPAPLLPYAAFLLFWCFLLFCVRPRPHTRPPLLCSLPFVSFVLS